MKDPTAHSGEVLADSHRLEIGEVEFTSAQLEVCDVAHPLGTQRVSSRDPHTLGVDHQMTNQQEEGFWDSVTEVPEPLGWRSSHRRRPLTSLEPAFTVCDHLVDPAARPVSRGQNQRRPGRVRWYGKWYRPHRQLWRVAAQRLTVQACCSRAITVLDGAHEPLDVDVARLGRLGKRQIRR